MKINHLNRVNMNPYIKQLEKMEQAQKTGKKDKIEISTEALELQKIGSIELDRLEKVENLKKQVQSGQYQVNPNQVANKMYSYWNELN